MKKLFPVVVAALGLFSACDPAALDRAGKPAAGSGAATRAEAATAPGTLPAGMTMGPSGPETKAQRDARMGWWREARFGMFIHWGLYAVPAGVYEGKPVANLGEWIMNYGAIPVATYAKYAEQFNPTKFDADEFVNTAKRAGMKYIVITAKHHDGFAMFNSAASDFNIVKATPFKRDIIKELETAAHKAGLRFGVYYSQSQDWHHPGGFSIGRNGRTDGAGWDPAQKGSFDEYLQKIAIPQTRELLSNYKLDVLWWDTPGPITKEQATPLHELLKMQPAIVSNNRLMNTRTAGAFVGDTDTPEQTIPANGIAGRDWESCMTINGTWGYKSTDTNFKPSETLIRNLIDCASKGGNYLLNVGPTAEGIIPQPEVDRLLAMGKWLEVNGESVYGTGPNPFVRAAAPVAATAASTSAPARGRPAAIPFDWRATTKPGKVYIHIMQWPADGKFQIPGSAKPLTITKAYLLADPGRAGLTVVRGADGVTNTILLPGAAPDAVASVVCLEVR